MKLPDEIRRLVLRYAYQIARGDDPYDDWIDVICELNALKIPAGKTTISILDFVDYFLSWRGTDMILDCILRKESPFPALLLSNALVSLMEHLQRSIGRLSTKAIETSH